MSYKIYLSKKYKFIKEHTSFPKSNIIWLIKKYKAIVYKFQVEK